MVERTLHAHRFGDCAERARILCKRRAVGLRAGFSLIELLVVMAVAVLLTALMMPAMQQLRENGQRVVCMSNMRQLGHAFFLFGGDHDDALPVSESMSSAGGPQELMLARRAGAGEDKWDGLGRLYLLHYCDTSECFYCPSHHGQHPYERYANMWTQDNPATPIYTNYHYAGHMQWNKSRQRRSLLEGYDLVLTTDGLRTANDFNHVLGMNSLRGDGSVHWSDDTDSILALLPKTEQEQAGPQYLSLWDLVQDQK